MTRQHLLTAVLVVGVIGLIGLAAYAVHSALSPETDQITLVTPVVCTACGHVGSGPVTRPPVKCGKCAKESAYPALKCTQCNIIVACDRQKFRSEGRDPYCSKCNSTQLAQLDSASP